MTTQCEAFKGKTVEMMVAELHFKSLPKQLVLVLFVACTDGEGLM